MRTPKRYPQLPTRYFRSEVNHCPTCQTYLRRATLPSRRTINTLNGPVRIAHWGSRCPNSECPTCRLTYRSRAADALALPGFTFGLDVVLLVGKLRLVQHQTVDEMYQSLLEQGDTQVLFQVVYLLRERRLRHLQPLGRARDVEFLSHDDKVAYLAEFHRLLPCSFI